MTCGDTCFPRFNCLRNQLALGRDDDDDGNIKVAAKNDFEFFLVKKRKENLSLHVHVLHDCKGHEEVLRQSLAMDVKEMY